MKWDQVENRWQEFAGSARAHWSKLTAEDWHAITGSRGYLIGRIKTRYEISREEAERQVDDWSDALVNSVEASGTR
jgi:uncharacterized protein YjbJ (UPF0337 family)